MSNKTNQILKSNENVKIDSNDVSGIDSFK